MTDKSDRFGPFSLSEVTSAFTSFDLDHNNYVGANELRYIYKELGEEVTDEEIDEMIRMVDMDGDGQVNRKEFTNMIFKYAGQKPDPPGTGTDQSAAAPAPAAVATVAVKTAAPMPNTTTTAGGDNADDDGDAIAAAKNKSLPDWDDNKESNITESTAAASTTQYSVAKSQLRSKKIKSALKACNLTGNTLTELLHSHNTVSLDFDGEQLKYKEWVSYFQFPIDEKNQQEYITLFELFDDDSAGSINIRIFLCSLLSFIDWPIMEKLNYSFSIFESRDPGAESLLLEDLCDLLKAIYLAPNNTDAMKRKALSIFKHTESANRPDEEKTISLNELENIQTKYPGLLFPSPENK